MTSDVQLGAPQKPSLRVLDVNVFGTIFSIKLFLHHFLKQNTTPGYGTSGKIIITGSEGGLFAMPADPIYCGSKHAVSTPFKYPLALANNHIKIVSWPRTFIGSRLFPESRDHSGK